VSGVYVRWTVFAVFILGMLALDLFVFHRRAHEVRIREALRYAAMWISLALLFNLWIYFTRGHDAAIEFLTAYLIEESLSLDNLFVFLLLFSYFGVPPAYQHKVLFWGILGALVMRFVFIVAGVSLISQFHWVIYLFGAVLVWSGIRMAKGQDVQVQPERSPVLRMLRRFLPIHSSFDGSRFFTRDHGRLLATPLFVVLVMVETTDLVFAVDSIPAVLAISRDPFIIYTSNVFAILGLRSLFFALAGLMRVFRYLGQGLSAILVFVGVKMILSDLFPIPTPVALGVVAAVLAVSVVASLLTRGGAPPRCSGAG